MSWPVSMKTGTRGKEMDATLGIEDARTATANNTVKSKKLSRNVKHIIRKTILTLFRCLNSYFTPLISFSSQLTKRFIVQ